MANNENLITSAAGRLLRLGSVATRVGMSLAAQQALGFVLSDPIAQARKTEKFVLNAMRVTEALGELKGAAMKAGQMLSVHEGLLPPEVSAVMRSLQQQAPPVSYETMAGVIRTELGEGTFESLNPVPIAAASIGQVYRARLKDGREVAVKVQYPEIDRVVRSDLKNLKKLFAALVAMFADVEFDEIWEELKARLLEELDYLHEADNIRRMVDLHHDVPEVIVPGLIAEASSRRVLTMDYVPGISPDEACSGRYGQALRDRWGWNLMTLIVRGLLTHRFLHADPNFANFAFLEDGRVIVYDHGCMKAISPELARNYARLLKVVIDDDKAALPGVLVEAGIFKRRTGAPVPSAVLDPMVDMMKDIVSDVPFRFTAETELYDLAMNLKSEHLSDLTDVSMPPDMVFVNRSLSGLFGNLCRLQAQGRWRDLLLEHIANAC